MAGETVCRGIAIVCVAACTVVLAMFANKRNALPPMFRKTSASAIAKMGQSRFDTINPGPPDPFRQLIAEYGADTSPKKVNLASGMYWDDQGKLTTLPVVEKAKQLLELDPRHNHGYLPIHGIPSFVSHAQRLVFGEALAESLLSGTGSGLASLQTISGAGANHLGANFLAQNIHPRRVWIPDVSWDNHPLVWQLARDSMSRGREPLEVRFYPYHDKANHTFDFQGMMRVLEEETEPNDVLLLHACAHNPTGVDPSRGQWEIISKFCSLRKLFPFFDLAYQGLATGSLDDDAWAIRHFVSNNLELCVAQTFSKIMGLYGERVGAFHLVTSSADAARRSFSELSRLQKGEIYSPPAFGANVATKIMSTPELHDEWRRDIFAIHKRLTAMRTALVKELKKLGTPGGWEYIEKQVGMFACTDLTAEQVFALKTRYHIYATSSGRISIAGLNAANVAYVAAALDTVIQERTGAHECKEPTCRV